LAVTLSPPIPGPHTFQRDRAWINALHLELCRIPAPTFQEQRRALWIHEQLRGYGCDAKLDKAGNVLCFPHGDSGAGPLIALTAHMDTVLAPRTPEEIRVAPDGRFLGPGVADNGSGLTALLVLARILRGLPPIPVLLAATVGEEGEGNLSGMRFLCRPQPLGQRLSAILVLDGPGVEQITTRALGSRRYEIQFNGPGGHSWADFGAGNPAHALARAMTLFADRFGNGLPRASFNFGIIEGGASINSIPFEARAKLDLRCEDAARLDQLSQLLSETIESALQAENARAKKKPLRVTARIREIGSRPAGGLDPRAPLLRVLEQVDRSLGIKSNEDCASTDANIPLSLGMQAVSLGAGGSGGGAHTPAEWYSPEGRELALRRILSTVCQLADGSPDRA
jgi:acetylornithine deacetylase/succinyl-diaminopimelate desuccinylase-like protein